LDLPAAHIRKRHGDIAILTHRAVEQRVEGLYNRDIRYIGLLPAL
jgi:hypothetical protein